MTESMESSNIIEWNDAQIRWTEVVPKKTEEEEEDDTPPDVFAPNPHTTFTLFQDIQLDGYTYDSDPTWNSTGLTLWKASEYLCQHSLMQQVAKEKRILELGAGLGLCGILAHRLGARSVHVTDGDSDVLVVLLKNIQNNRLQQQQQQQQQQHISGHQLLWGTEHAQKFQQTIADNELFDVILAADVVYVPQVIPPLFETVQTLLKHDTGVFVLAFARRMVNVTVDDVLAQAVQAGFVYEKCSSDADTEQGLYLYCFRHKKASDESLQ